MPLFISAPYLKKIEEESLGYSSFCVNAKYLRELFERTKDSGDSFRNSKSVPVCEEQPAPSPSTSTHPVGTGHRQLQR